MVTEKLANKNDNAEAIRNHVSAQINPKVIQRYDSDFMRFRAINWFLQFQKERFHPHVKTVDAMLNTSLDQLIKFLGLGHISGKCVSDVQPIFKMCEESKQIIK